MPSKPRLNPSQPNPRSNVLCGAYAELNDLLELRFRPFSLEPAGAQTRTGFQAGLRLSKQKGRGVDFAEVRQYQHGDDIRSIDWRVTARKNAPHTKVFREEREYPVLLFVDQSQLMFFGSQQRLKSVAAAELAARLAWHITGQGDRVGGVVLDNDGHHLFRPFRTAKATGRLLAQIASSNHSLRRADETFDETAGLSRLRSALEDLTHLRHQRLRIFVISDLVSASRSGALDIWQDALQRLGQRHQVTAIQITDPLDKALPPSANYRIRQGSRQLSFFSGNKSLRQQYALGFEEHAEAIRKLCLHPRLQYLELSTQDTNWDVIHLSPTNKVGS